MAAYRRVYDSCHLQADWQEPGSAPDPTLGYRVWATFTFFRSRQLTAFPRQHALNQPLPMHTHGGDGDVILFHIYVS